MVSVNDDIATKLAAEYSDTETSGTALLQRYRAGDIYLNMKGYGSSTVQCPSTAALNTTGRLWLACDLTMEDWTWGTAAASMVVFSKYEAIFNLKQWFVAMMGDGKIQAAFSSDGANDFAFFSTAAVAFANGARGAIACDIQPDNGAAGKTVTFYTAPTLAGPWVQLGAPVVQATAVSMWTNNNAVAVGGRGVLGPQQTYNGRVHACEMRQGHATPGAGTLLASPRFDGLGSYAPDSLGREQFYDGQLNLWTFNQGAAPGPWTTTSVAVASPNRASFNSFSDIDIRVKVSLADWSPASTHWILSHGNHTETVPDLRWVLSVHPNNALRAFFSVDGTLTGVGPESPVTGFVDGSEHFIRVTFDADTGGTDSTVTYYESFDNGQTWVVIGAPIVDPAGPITLFNVPLGTTTGKVDIGRLNSGTQTLKYLEVRNGINGPIVAQLDVENVPRPSYEAVGGAGETWQHANAPAKIVQVSDRLTWDQLVAHYAAASPNGFIDDQWAFWNAFVP